jgi:hypothetical protein
MFISPKIKVIGKFKKESFYCSICQFPLLTPDDFEKDSSYDCCYECYLKFAESRLEEWKNGWRPKKAVVNSYISIRRKLYKQSSKEK